MFFPLAALLVLAGQALAFNITFNNKTFQSGEILNIPQTSIPQNCSDSFNTAQQNIGACKDDATCLCKADLIKNLQDSQQCMFTYFITTNGKPLDMRVGSTPLLGAYLTSCTNANQTVTPAQVALTLPDNWDGPFDAILPVGGTAVAVIAGGFLGMAGLLLLSNLS